jgi:hypothetical protein
MSQFLCAVQYDTDPVYINNFTHVLQRCLGARRSDFACPGAPGAPPRRWPPEPSSVPSSPACLMNL